MFWHFFNLFWQFFFPDKDGFRLYSPHRTENQGNPTWTCLLPQKPQLCGLYQLVSATGSQARLSNELWRPRQAHCDVQMFAVCHASLCMSAEHVPRSSSTLQCLPEFAYHKPFFGLWDTIFKMFFTFFESRDETTCWEWWFYFLLTQDLPLFQLVYYFECQRGPQRLQSLLICRCQYTILDSAMAVLENGSLGIPEKALDKHLWLIRREGWQVDHQHDTNGRIIVIKKALEWGTQVYP